MFRLTRIHTKADRSDPGLSPNAVPGAGRKDDAQKPETLRDFRESLAQMIVQDLKDPITVIHGSLLYMLEELQENGGYFTEKIQRALQTSLMHCKRQMTMINDLLDISRLDPGRVPLRKSQTDFAQLVDSALASLDASLRKQGLSVQKAIPDGLPPMWLDDAVVWRVIVNLLSNSLKFSKPGGRIRIAVSTLENRWLECVVEDNGLAIPAADLARVFDRNFHGDPLGRFRKGQGFAFAFCRLAVEAHGGNIWAERGPNQANQFIFVIPVRPPEAVSASVPQSPPIV